STRLAALPTVDLRDPPDIPALIETYVGLGLRSIYLRPVNYQGFARRTPQSDTGNARWNAFHAAFINMLIERNYSTGVIVEEFYCSHCLRRMLRAGVDGHVDLRNPNPLAADCVVIDHDGRLYPTDEARMLARIGQVDLSVGDVAAGIHADRVGALDHAAL